MLKTIKYYLQRMRYLGVKQSVARGCDALAKTFFYLKDKLESKIKLKPKFNDKELSRNFFKRLARFKMFLHKNHPSLFQPKDKTASIINGKLEIFNKLYKAPKLNKRFWNYDFILQGKEIKVPWELGRCHFLTSMACSDPNSQKSKQIFNQFINSFIDNNDYLKTAQWKNPMEVAIRAINWIFSCSEFIEKNNRLCTKIFLSLKQHQKFIYQYLETSATPNNHLLMDLLGLAYLGVFFNDKDHVSLIDRTIEEFSKQVLPDGGFYEGSTSYHNLNLEALNLLKLLCTFIGIKNYKKLDDLLTKTTKFSRATGGILVGDNDSGKILPYKLHTPSSRKGAFVFEHFGLAILRKGNCTFSIRGFSTSPHQPKGHFHFDQLSITLKVSQQDIFIDPGSGFYTSKPKVRELQRSHKSHSAPFLQEQNCNNSSIFDCKIQEACNLLSLKQTKPNAWLAQAAIALPSGQTIKRTVNLIFKNNMIQKIIIVDSVSSQTKTILQTVWICGPNGKILNKSINQCILTFKDVKIHLVRGNLTYKAALYSPNYFLLKKINKVVCKKNINVTIRQETTFINIQKS